MRAVQCKSAKSVQILINLGAYPDYLNIHGNSALMMLATDFETNPVESVKIATLLIENGADLHAVNREGKSALMIAQERFKQFAEKDRHSLNSQFVSQLEQISAENQRYFKKFTGSQAMLPLSDEDKEITTRWSTDFFYPKAKKDLLEDKQVLPRYFPS